MDAFEAMDISMETPTIQKLENLLLVAVPRDLTDRDVLDLRRQVLEETRRYHSQWVLLDFSRVDICDSFFGRFIQSTASMVGLMGASVVVSGLQDAVVETMVDLGMTLPNIHAVLDLDDALALSREDQSEAWTDDSLDAEGELFDDLEWEISESDESSFPDLTEV